MRALIRTALAVFNQLGITGLARIALLAVQRVADRGLDFSVAGNRSWKTGAPCLAAVARRGNAEA